MCAYVCEYMLCGFCKSFNGITRSEHLLISAFYFLIKLTTTCSV